MSSDQSTRTRIQVGNSDGLQEENASPSHAGALVRQGSDLDLGGTVQGWSVRSSPDAGRRQLKSRMENNHGH